MKKIAGLMLVAVTGPFLSAQSLIKNLATVTYIKTEAISEQSFERTLSATEAQLGKNLTNTERKVILDSLVNSIILLQEANKEKTQITNDELLRGLQMMFQVPRATMGEIEVLYNSSPGAGVQSWRLFLEELKKQGLKEKYLSSKIIPPVPSDTEIQKIYDDNKDDFVVPNVARVSHIFFSFKSMSAGEKNDVMLRANRTLSQVKAGSTTFEQLVRSSSEDSVSSQRLGDIGYMFDTNESRQAYGKEFIDEIFSLKPGQISKVVSSSEGYHILKVTETEVSRLLKLSDMNPSNNQQTVKQMVIMQLQAKYFQVEVVNLVDQLRKSARIEINEVNWGPWVRGEKNPS